MKAAFWMVGIIGGLIAAGCAERSPSWPGIGGRSEARRPDAGAADYCPNPGIAVGRQRSQDGVAVATIGYVMSANGPPCVVSLNNGSARWVDLLGMRGFQIDEHSTLQPVGRAISELFPLEVGKTATATVIGYTAHGGNFGWRFDLEVIGREQISVPAGGYDTYVIRLTERGLPPNTFHVEHAAWIEPHSRIPLRVRHRIVSAEPRRTFVDWDATFIRQ